MSGKSFGVSLDDFLLSAQVAIENVRGDAEMAAVMARFGYEMKKMDEAKALLDESRKLVNSQKKEYGEQFAATDELDKAWTEADSAYIKSLKMARVALQDHVQARASMMIDGSRRQSLSGWIQQAEAFYGNLLDDPELIAGMAKFGYTQETLSAEYDLVKKVGEKNLKQKKETGEAQKATEARDSRIDELGKWLSDFRAVAKIAFSDDPQMLEKIGILARSSAKPALKSKEDTPPAPLS